VNAPWSLILKVFAFVAFVIDCILVVAKATTPELIAFLLPFGLACWVLAEIIGPTRSTA
jgi:hypothetical protein